MKNTWKNIKEMITYPEGGITSKVIEKNELGDVTLFCMSGGTSISDHTSTKAGYIYVIEGKGTFILEGEKIEMTPGTLIVMRSNAVHSLSAQENTSFILLLRDI
ncbi:MAG: cupin domain-containing protein [Candidatus Undinarchaeales archaeon]|nr:cupin domain-containing protein [Candidatus Undinarchaeales archaeon]MDP7492876.1 cupin domain-containing protein [Candidatus Undinarchaeales archaeon]